MCLWHLVASRGNVKKENGTISIDVNCKGWTWICAYTLHILILYIDLSKRSMVENEIRTSVTGTSSKHDVVGDSHHIFFRNVCVYYIYEHIYVYIYNYIYMCVYSSLSYK